jgi:hypothetical protein
MGALDAVPSATTVAKATEETAVEAAGTTVTPARTGAISLVRTAGRASLATALGVTSPARTVLTAMLAFLCCRHLQGEMTTTAKMMGLGASRSHARSLASWVVLRPPPLIASSSSSLAR